MPFLDESPEKCVLVVVGKVAELASHRFRRGQKGICVDFFPILQAPQVSKNYVFDTYHLPLTQ